MLSLIGALLTFFREIILATHHLLDWPPLVVAVALGPGAAPRGGVATSQGIGTRSAAVCLVSTTCLA